MHLYLYSKDVLKLNCPQGSGDAPWQKKALCHAVSDSDGRFGFSSVPCGILDLYIYLDFILVFLFILIHFRKNNTPSQTLLAGSLILQCSVLANMFVSISFIQFFGLH